MNSSLLEEWERIFLVEGIICIKLGKFEMVYYILESYK